MNCELSQRFYFEAAHTLKRDIDSAGSKRIHGHTYHADITIEGVPDPKTGMLMDLGLVRREIERVRELLDHRLLDDVEGLGPPTLENLCAFLFKALHSALPALTRVTIERAASGDRCSLRRVP